MSLRRSAASAPADCMVCGRYCPYLFVIAMLLCVSRSLIMSSVTCPEFAKVTA